MTAAEARYVTELLDGLEALPQVIEGLNEADVFFELAACHPGGAYHGDARIPARLGTQIIAFAKKCVLEELSKLNVEPTRS